MPNKSEDFICADGHSYSINNGKFISNCSHLLNLHDFVRFSAGIFLNLRIIFLSRIFVLPEALADEIGPPRRAVFVRNNLIDVHECARVKENVENHKKPREARRQPRIHLILIVIQVSGDDSSGELG